MKPSHSVAFTLSVALIVGSVATGASAQSSLAAQRGQQVSEQWCVTCHAIGAGNRATDAAPPFAAIASYRSPDYIRGFLANPHTRGEMPAFDLARQDIEDIVAYLQTLR